MNNENKKFMPCGKIEQFNKEQLAEKRRLRLLQVREQSKEIAKEIRQNVKKEKDKELEKLKENILQEKLQEKENQIHYLNQLYHESVNEIGSGWLAVKNQEEREQESKVKEQLNNEAAYERGKAALFKRRQEKMKLEEQSKANLLARKFALDVEKERAAEVCSLPKPDVICFEDLVKNANSRKQNIYKQPSDILVERADPSVEPCGFEVAACSAMRQQEMDAEKAKLKQQRNVQAKERFHAAWERECNDKECLKTMRDIENGERLSRRQAQKEAYDPSEVRPLICSPLDSRQKKNRQCLMEDIVEKCFASKEHDVEDLEEPHAGFENSFNFEDIERNEVNAEVTDYIEPMFRNPCTSLLEPLDDKNVTNISITEQNSDFLNMGYMESPEDKDVPRKSFAAVSADDMAQILVKLQKRRAELDEESLNVVKALSEPRKEKVTSQPKNWVRNMACQTDEMSSTVSQGVQTDKMWNLVSTGIQVDTNHFESALQGATSVHHGVSSFPADSGFDSSLLSEHKSRQMTTLDSRKILELQSAHESSVTSSTSYLSLPPQHSVPELPVLLEGKCSVCEYDQSQTLQVTSILPLRNNYYSTQSPQTGTKDAILYSAVDNIGKPIFHELQHSEAEGSVSSQSSSLYFKQLTERYNNNKETLHLPESSYLTTDGLAMKQSDKIYKTAIETCERIDIIAADDPNRYSPGSAFQASNVKTVFTGMSEQNDSVKCDTLKISNALSNERDNSQKEIEKTAIDFDSFNDKNIIDNKDELPVSPVDDETHNLLVLHHQWIDQISKYPAISEGEFPVQELDTYLSDIPTDILSEHRFGLDIVKPNALLKYHELSTILEVDTISSEKPEDNASFQLSEPAVADKKCEDKCQVWLQNVNKNLLVSASSEITPVYPSHEPVSETPISVGNFPPEYSENLFSPTTPEFRTSLESFCKMTQPSLPPSAFYVSPSSSLYTAGQAYSSMPKTPKSATQSSLSSFYPMTQTVLSSLDPPTPVTSSSFGSLHKGTKASMSTPGTSTSVVQSSLGSFHPMAQTFLSTPGPPTSTLHSSLGSPHSMAQISISTSGSSTLPQSSLGSFHPMAQTFLSTPDPSTSTVHSSLGSSHSVAQIILSTPGSSTLPQSSLGSFHSMAQTVLSMPDTLSPDQNLLGKSCMFQNTDFPSLHSPTLTAQSSFQPVANANVSSSDTSSAIQSSLGSFHPMAQTVLSTLGPLSSAAQSSLSTFHPSHDTGLSSSCPPASIAENSFQPVTNIGFSSSDTSPSAAQSSLGSFHTMAQTGLSTLEPYTSALKVKNSRIAPHLTFSTLNEGAQTPLGSVASSQENLTEMFTDSKIMYQSTPVKIPVSVLEARGILEEPDLTLIGSEMSSRFSTPVKAKEKLDDDTLVEEPEYPRKASLPVCDKVSLAETIEPEVNVGSDDFNDIRTLPVTVQSPTLSESLLSFQEHEISAEKFAGEKLSLLVSNTATPSRPHDSETYSPYTPSDQYENSECESTPSATSKIGPGYKSRTKRLWNNLPEVKERRMELEKKQAFLKNKEKVKQLQMSLAKRRLDKLVLNLSKKLQKSRQLVTPKK